MKAHCENCKWTHKNPLRDPSGAVQIGTIVYTCHRFPPSAVLMQTSPGMASLVAMFPPVTKDMVCSLHEFPDGDGAMLSGDVPGAFADN